MAYYDYSRDWHRLHGHFRVLYKDGQVSQPFSYWAARAYAKIFGGKVVWKNARFLQKQ